MRLILNESLILKQSLEKGYVNEKKTSVTIKLLTKYYLSTGMDKRQTEESISSFLKKNKKKYNPVKWINTIEKIVKDIYKQKDYNMFDIGEINISENELNTISNINNLKLEKLAFVLLVYAKIYNKLNNKMTNWVNEEYKYIFSDAKLTIREFEQPKLIYQLKELGLVEPSVIVDKTNIKVLFANENSEIAISMSDFRNFVYEYLKWKGEKIINCSDCGILIKPKNNKQSRCTICARNKQLEWQKESMKKSRDGECEVIENPYNH